MSQFCAHVHLFCFPLGSNDHVGQLVPDGLSADGSPIIQKVAAIIYSFQVVISESESKVRVSSPFSQLRQLILPQSNQFLLSSVMFLSIWFPCVLYEQLHLTSTAQSLCSPPRVVPMASKKVLNTVYS